MTRAIELRAEGISWHAGTRRILGPLDLAVEQGECLVVVGPNGAGKTTLLRLIVGLLEPGGGKLFWRDRVYREFTRRELAQRIAYVPQARPLAVPLTVEDLVLLGRYPYLSPLQFTAGGEDYEAAARALAMVEIESLRHRPLTELSGGERQAAYVAAALAQEGSLLVLDEPTTHLDPSHQRRIAALIEKLRRKSGATVLLATHDLNLAALLADRVLALRNGEILAVGPPAEILAPAMLGELFEAPFEVVRGGSRPMTMLDLGER